MPMSRCCWALNPLIKSVLVYSLERIGSSGVATVLYPSTQITSNCRLSIACNEAVVVRVQIAYTPVFMNGPLCDRKAVLISQPSKDILSYHFWIVIILIAKIVISDWDIAFVGFPFLACKGILRTVAAAPLHMSEDSWSWKQLRHWITSMCVTTLNIASPTKKTGHFVANLALRISLVIQDWGLT